MPLTKQQALELHQAIADIPFEARRRKAELRWISLMAPSKNPMSSPSSNNPLEHLKALNELQPRLIELRKAHLNTKSVEIKFGEGSAFGKKTIRVFDPTREKNFNCDIPDIFARGIDSANAVIEILKYAFPLKLRDSQGTMQSLTDHPNKKAIETLMDLIFHFKDKMAHHQASEGKKRIAAAMKELKRFNAALASLLVEYNVVEERSHAKKAISLVRDFVWKRDLCTAHCSVENKAEGSTHTMFRYAEPMTFGPSEFRVTGSKSRLDLWKKKDRVWLDDFAGKLGLSKSNMAGSWFEKFLDTNKDPLESLSSTPMTRFTPNPANAFDCTDFMVDDNGELVQMGHHVRMAITDPLEIKNPIERQKLTDFNHLQLFSKTRLAKEIAAFMDNWGCLFKEGDNSPIPLTVLHQTLIGDEVTLSPDQTKAVSGFDGSVIDAKQEANAAVRTMLSKSLILCQREKPHAVMVLNKSCIEETDTEVKLYTKSPSGQRGELLATYPYDQYQKVEISLLETNNCVNMWHSRARIRNNDVNDARQLINQAVVLFERCNQQLNNPDLSIIIEFLKSRDHSLFTPYKHRGEAVKAAVRNVSDLLRNQPLPGDLGGLNRENLNLSLQAAVELKCTVHETWFGSMRRVISNFTRDVRDTVPVIGHVINWATRFVLWTLSTAITILAFPLHAPSYIKHLADRKEIAKANYEGLLAESIGALMGGCMSAADRAGEIDEQRAALRRQFADKGVLLGYNDSPEKKLAFFKAYGSTRTKHDNVEMATGAPVTNDSETRGFSPLLYVAKFLAAIKLISPEVVNLMTVGLMSSRVETEEERETNAQMSGLRKTGYDKKVKASSLYLKPKEEAVVLPDAQGLQSVPADQTTHLKAPESDKDSQYPAQERIDSVLNP